MAEIDREFDDDRDERRVAALRKTLSAFADASRRALEEASGEDGQTAALRARALRRVAWTTISDEDDDSVPNVPGADGAAAGRRRERAAGPRG